MGPKPIFVVTHPRSCSTAFERVFMARDDLKCQHEPFGDAFYYGPERASPRFEQDEEARMDSGHSETTFKHILDHFEAQKAEGKGLFIKDMAYYFFPTEGVSPSIAPSLARVKRGVGTTNGESNGHSSSMTNGTATDVNGSDSVNGVPNPTVVPAQTLGEFQFAFLIRHPRYSIPSYYRCTVPPLDKKTGWYDFLPSEAGYRELKLLFDYLCSTGHVGPEKCGHVANGVENGANGSADHQAKNHEANGEKSPNGKRNNIEICLVDADDLLDHPADVVSAFCKSVGLEYDESMLKWDEEHTKQAQQAFEKWTGFHDDALSSSCLKPREHHKKIKPDEVEDAEWREKFGEEGAKVIRETVNANVADYEYLKQFTLKF